MKLPKNFPVAMIITKAKIMGLGGLAFLPKSTKVI